MKCAETVADGQKLHHQRKCGTHSFHRSGPDLVVFWATGEVYYDLTVVNELAKSHLGKKASHLLQEAQKKKVATYVDSNLIPREQFVCLPLLTGGAMNKSTINFLHSLADANGFERRHILEDFKLLLQELNGALLASQLRKTMQ